MESETFRFILITIFIPFATYKIYRFYKKLFKLTERSISKQLEKRFEKIKNFS
tara:strand:- start:2095 stop:2253 length:159 start_codon:yes stop_codon:yes gene_type:complete